jgi:hypothetical protein
MERYALRRADEETARRVAEAVAGRFDIERIRVRGLAEAVRASGDENVVPEGETGYFEEDLDPDELGRVLDALGSLSRVVLYADSPVFAWFEDGKVRFRGDEALLEGFGDTEIDVSVADDTPESVVAEMTDEE